MRNFGYLRALLVGAAMFVVSIVGQASAVTVINPGESKIISTNEIFFADVDVFTPNTAISDTFKFNNLLGSSIWSIAQVNTTQPNAAFDVGIKDLTFKFTDFGGGITIFSGITDSFGILDLTKNVFSGFLDTGITTLLVTGMSLAQGGSYDFTLAIAPLPAALPLFGTGLGILGFLGWRRRRKQTAQAAA